MKKILALTDLSENSAHAVRFAAMLARQMHKKLLLYHSYAVIPVIPSYAGAPWVARDIQHAARLQMARLQELAETVSLAGPEELPKIEVSCGEGSLVTNVKNILEHNDTEIIVMGASSGRRLDHFLNGRDTLDIIRNCHRPVLIVPHNAAPESIQKIILATTFHDRDIPAIHYLVNLAKLLAARLEVTHVQHLHDTADEERLEISFRRLLDSFKYPLITYRKVRGKSVSARLLKEGKEYEADMLALIYHSHNFLADFFEPGTLRRLLAHHNLPVMVLSSQMKVEY